MNHLKITAFLSTPCSLTNDRTPMLDALLASILLQQNNSFLPNPTKKDVVQVLLPLKSSLIMGQKIWHSSVPYYKILSEEISSYKKRWDYQEAGCDWKGKKAQVDTSCGVTKSTNTPMRLLNLEKITWYCEGDKDKLGGLITKCKFIGGKRSLGKGLISEWEIKPVDYFFNLINPQGCLIRPIPIEYADNPKNELFFDTKKHNKLFCSWQMPYWLSSNFADCYVPRNNVKKQILKPLISV